MSLDVKDLKFNHRQTITKIEKGGQNDNNEDEDLFISGLGKSKGAGSSDVQNEFGDMTVMESGNKKHF